MKLEEIYETLKDFAEKEEDLQCKWPCDSNYNVPNWHEIYDALEIIDSIINYEPSDAEYIITPQERDKNSLDSKRESHSHRYYSHNW